MPLESQLEKIILLPQNLVLSSTLGKLISCLVPSIASMSRNILKFNIHSTFSDLLPEIRKLGPVLNWLIVSGPPTVGLPLVTPFILTVSQKLAVSLDGYRVIA